MTFASELMCVNMSAFVLLIVVSGMVCPALLVLCRFWHGRKSIENSEFPCDDSLDIPVQRWVDMKMFCVHGVSREDAAAEMGISEEDLVMYLKETIGMDFKTWRNHLRIEESKRLLLECRDLSVSTIGNAVGFADRSNFHNFFIKIVGCSPTVWRESGGNPSL